jgi:hypothetical protein
MKLLSLVFLVALSLSAKVFALGETSTRDLLWADNPLSFTAITTHDFVQQMRRYVIAPFGTQFTFSKKSGPEWMTLSEDGRTSGVPTEDELGPNSFVISVSDGQVTKETRLEVQVEKLEPIE